METVPARVPELQLQPYNPAAAAAASSTSLSSVKKKEKGKGLAGTMWSLSRNAVGFVREAAISKAEKWSEGLKAGKEEMKAKRKGKKRKGEEDEDEEEEEEDEEKGGKEEWRLSIR
jgi:hypothetical protein